MKTCLQSPICLSIYLSICLSIYSSMYLICCTFAYAYTSDPLNKPKAESHCKNKRQPQTQESMPQSRNLQQVPLKSRSAESKSYQIQPSFERQQYWYPQEQVFLSTWETVIVSDSVRHTIAISPDIHGRKDLIFWPSNTVLQPQDLISGILWMLRVRHQPQHGLM